MNVPPRWEHFVLPEGVRKVTYEKDTKIHNAATFVLEREDHTVGNLLRMELLQNPNVLFAGYKVPHPLEYKVEIKVQASRNSNPMTAFKTAISKTLKHVESLDEQMKDQIQSKRSDPSHDYS